MREPRRGPGVAPGRARQAPRRGRRFPTGGQTVARSPGAVRERAMSLPVILRPAAEADIQTTHDELEQLQPGSGGRFVARVREVLERIESMPEMYGLVWQDVRAARLRRFRHLVYYVV